MHYLRENKLKRGYVSDITGIPYPTISKWDNEYDGSYRKKPREELRGVQNLVSEGFIEMIKNFAKEYIKNHKRGETISILKKFLKWMGKTKSEELKKYPFGRSRRVITEILIANKLYKEQVKKNKYPPYYPRIKRYYPGAQLVLDGKELKIHINDQEYSHNLEMAKDICSDGITSHVIREEETAEAVVSVIDNHVDKHGIPLSILIDNSSANLSSEVKEKLKGQEIQKICAFPGRGETKGDIEGEFSKIEEKLGKIHIKGKTLKELSRSIIEAIINLYIEMRNQTPRCSVCNRTPLKLMNYVPAEEERSKAKRSLDKQRERSELIRETKSAQSSENEILIQGLVERNRLEISDMERFVKVMLRYDLKAIKGAEEAFYSYSFRDSFTESKRNGHYFVGIVKNMQAEIDLNRKKELLKARYLIDEKWKQKREELKRIREEQEEEKRIKKYPEMEIVKWLIEGQRAFKTFGWVPKVFLQTIRKGIEVIISKTNWKDHLELLKNKIMSLKEYDLEQRLAMVNRASRWINESQKMGVKSVTLF